MNDDRLRCAESALRQVPADYRTIEAAVVAGQHRGRSFHNGMHIAWAWGEDDSRRPFLDFLSNHPHPGMQAHRYFTDGRVEPIATPASARTVSSDPAEDAELERRFFEHNRAAYENLRDRGLLPPEGDTLSLLGVNEYLLKGGLRSEESKADADFAAGQNAHLLGGGWHQVLRKELEKTYWSKLLEFIADEYEQHDHVYPPKGQIFKALELTRYEDVKVVILGQDPYPNPGEAHGLAFSVPTDLSWKPDSLKNIHKVLVSDLSRSFGRPVPTPEHGSLEGWAQQGVLLLNTALTVRAGSKADRKVHRQWRWDGQGWSTFTDAVITAVDSKRDGVVFILWGMDAIKKEKLIDHSRHAVIKSSHPSPLSAWRGFLTSSPFSDANKELKRLGQAEIDWELINPT